MRTVLLTGFGPFPGAPFNPSGNLVQHLAQRRRPGFADIKLVPHVFATSYRSVDADLPKLIAQHRPDAILMFGLASRSRHVRIEMQARNARAAMPDASGFSQAASAIGKAKDGRRQSRAPVNALLRAARTGKIPARLSHDAGRYVCNYLYWHGLEAAMRPGGPKLVTFIHIPNVRRASARKDGKPERFCDRDLVTTGEAILFAVVSALNRGNVR